MTKVWIIFTACVCAFAQQGFDLKSLDKLASKAAESTNINLEGDALKLAAGFLDGKKGNEAQIKSLVNNLKSVFVRSFEFDKEGEYSQDDLAPLRAQLKSAPWNKIVDVKEKDGETSEIYLLPMPGGQIGGLVIISAEPKELTVVYVNGNLKMEDLKKLGGNMGIPDMAFMNNNSGKSSAPQRNKSVPKDDEQE